MREIKFRAWDKVYKKMIIDEQEFVPIKITNKGVLRLSPYCEKDVWEFINDDRFELMQGTGLKDKNDKEIYEGDLVKVLDYANWEGLYKVVWDNENSMYVLKDAYGDKEKMCEFECFLIKGNIYENPELLEVENE